MAELLLCRESALRAVRIPDCVQSLNVYLTYRCGYGCADCTNNLVARRDPGMEMSAGQWIEGLGRLEGMPTLVIRGGEPSQHPGFLEIVEELSGLCHLRIISNLEFDVSDFPGRVSPERMNAQETWAPIRATFHLGKTDPRGMLEKVLFLEECGFRVGIIGMAGPAQEETLRQMQRWFLSWGTDFRIRRFVGYVDGALTGNFRFAEATGQREAGVAVCRTSQISIAPDGRVYRCRHDCLGAEDAMGDLLDQDLTLSMRHRPCTSYGLCHPCDVEVRPQEFKGAWRSGVEILGAD